MKKWKPTALFIFSQCHTTLLIKHCFHKKMLCFQSYAKNLSLALFLLSFSLLLKRLFMQNKKPFYWIIQIYCEKRTDYMQIIQLICFLIIHNKIYIFFNFHNQLSQKNWYLCITQLTGTINSKAGPWVIWCFAFNYVQQRRIQTGQEPQINLPALHIAPNIKKTLLKFWAISIPTAAVVYWNKLIT